MSDELEIIYSDVEFARYRARRKQIVVCIGAWITIAAILPWIVFALLKGLAFLLILDGLAVAGAVQTLILCRRGQMNIAPHLLLAVLIVYITTGTIVVEGVVNGQANYAHHWLLVIVMGMLMTLYDTDRRVSWAYLGICGLIYAAIELQWFESVPTAPLPLGMQAIYPQLTMLPIFIVVIMITWVFVADIRRAEQLLALANNKLETLIENMLPPVIAERLRHEGRSFADGVEECSVLFADIVGFTSLSARMSPEELVELLNRLFGCFDDLAEKFGVEKIKTIGDAYMVAAGLPNPKSDHAETLARFALAMLGALEAFPGLSLRIGINSGAVVAGVIGKKRFIYDMWGDTVNMAQRMESHGVPGSIQVTRSTYDLIVEKFSFVEQGRLNVKGRVGVEAFLLVGEKAGAAA